MKKQLWEICRDKKDSANPRITNQQLVENTGLSVNAIGQYLRGETPNAPLSTFGPICRCLGVSVDDYLGLERPPAQDAELAAKLESEQKMLRVYQSGVRKRDAVIGFLLILVMLALGALLVDVMNPNVGWIRETAAITENHFCGEPTQEGARNELLYQV